MSIVRSLDETHETAHPFLTDVGMRTLYSMRDDKGEVTCFVVRCKVGAEIERALIEVYFSAVIQALKDC